jgi:hypothetical protein
MNRTSVIRWIVMLVLGVAAALWFTREQAGDERAPAPAESPPRTGPMPDEPRRTGSSPPAADTPVAAGQPADNAVRVARIHRDYDEMRAQAAAEYRSAGPAYPGGLNAYLRQLALLEREKRRDLAAVLGATELENLELRDSSAGQLVQRLLGTTSATGEQRRAVFRLQQAFEDDFALSFDLSPEALYARETARQTTQEQIRAVLGDALFGAWLRGEGPEFDWCRHFALRHGLREAAALELWRAKNEFTLRRLELNAQRGLPAGQLQLLQAQAVRDAEVRVSGILGPGIMPAARREVLGWLPQR